METASQRIAIIAPLAKLYTSRSEKIPLAGLSVIFSESDGQGHTLAVVSENDRFVHTGGARMPWGVCDLRASMLVCMYDCVSVCVHVRVCVYMCVSIVLFSFFNITNKPFSLLPCV